MALLSGFNVSVADVKLMGEASMAAFAGKPVPAGWTVLTPAQLGLAAQYQDGNYFKNGNSGAAAIVLQQGSDYIVAFRGSDDAADVASYLRLHSGSYINFFSPLLNAVAAHAPAGANFSFTGASLGGGAVNNLAAIAGSAYGGEFSNATFVAFASPNITNASDILNIGYENDPVYKVAGRYANYESSLDNLVLANDEYVAGNYNGLRPYSLESHSDKKGFELFDRLLQSVFYDDMNPDSVVVVAASDGIIQDLGPGRSKVGAFYLGRSTGDYMLGRSGNDSMEGFGGKDVLKGGGGHDRIEGGIGDDNLNGEGGNDVVNGGDGDDTLIATGSEARFDTFDGGVGTDTLRVTGKGNATLAGFDAAASSIEILQGNGKALLGDASANSFDFTALTAVSAIAYVDGAAGNDTIIGSSFADTLRGGAGDDTLAGGLGDDTLTGGNNFDTFAFGLGFGKDTITDFTEGAGLGDLIRFDTNVFADFNAVMAAAVQVGGNVEIHFDASNVLTLIDVSLTAPVRLVEDDFLFV